MSVYTKKQDYSANRCLAVSEADLLATCKRTGNTPSTLLAFLYSKALKSIYPDSAEDIMCSLAVSLRSDFDNSKTMQNSALFTNLKITDRVLNMPDEKAGTVLRGQLLLGCDPSIMSFTKNYMQKTYNALESIPFFWARRAVGPTHVKGVKS